MAQFECVIPSAAAFQAERGIWRGAATHTSHARSLGPLEKARAFGMTQMTAEIQTEPLPKDAGRMLARNEGRIKEKENLVTKNEQERRSSYSGCQLPATG